MTPLTGVPIPDSGSSPSNFSAALAAAFERSETFDNLRYADASTRDAAITSPISGQVSWLDSPGRFEYYRDGAWVPEGLPAQGTVHMPATSRPDNDRTITVDGSENATQLGSAVEFPVPPWAQEGSGLVKLINSASVRINGTAHWRLFLEWSFDAGAAWSSSQHVSCRASGDSEYGIFCSNGNGNTDVSIPAGTTTVRARLKAYRFSGTAAMEIATANTLYQWTCDFYDTSTEMPTVL